jgi:protein-disulfide isomerase
MTKFVLRSIVLVAVFALVIDMLGGDPARAEHDAATPEQERIERVIRNYLLNHPDVVVEVLQVMRRREQISKADRSRADIAAYRESLLNDPTSPVAGNPDGDVTIVEFFDYNCPYCKRVFPHVKAVLAEDQGVRVVYKEFPILGPGSLVAARAALASLKQDGDKYLAFHNAMMASRRRLTETRIMDIARAIGFDTERLKADMAAPEIEQIIRRNRGLAQALGITGTPTFVVGDQLVPGAISLDALRQLIARARTS